MHNPFFQSPEPGNHYESVLAAARVAQLAKSKAAQEHYDLHQYNMEKERTELAQAEAKYRRAQTP